MANRLILAGNVGKAPDVRFTQDGKAIANFSLATQERYKDSQGNRQEITDWHKCVAFGKLAELIQQYVTSGTKLYLECKSKTRKWQDNNGQDRYVTEAIIEKMEFIGGTKSQDESNANNQQRPSNQNQPAQPMQEPGFSFDDDIPFAPIGLQYPALLNCL